MTEKKGKKKTGASERFVIDARVQGEREVPRRMGKFWAALEYLVGFVPSYRDSRKGRATAKQVRIVLVALGLLLMAFGGAESAWWVLVGVALASSAFAIPVTELKKRSWRAKLQQKQSPEVHETWEAGCLVYDGRRVELHQGDKKLRHVLVNRGKHRLERGSWEGALCLAIKPAGRRKKETIFVVAEGREEGEERKFKKSEVDRIAKVSGEEFDRLQNALKKEEGL